MRCLLLILVIFVAANLCSAQTSAPWRKKMSPGMSAHFPAFDNEQQPVFWISVSNIDSLKQYVNENKLPVSILRENLATQLLVVKTSWKVMDSLLPLRFTRFAEWPRKPKEEMALGIYDISLNRVNVLHRQLPGLNGNGLVVSIKENRFDTTDIDFEGRYLPTALASPDFAPHATIMATIIGGVGNTFYTGTGVAPAVTLSSSNFVSLLPDPDNDYRRYNISVQNHSYGTGIENYYGADAAAYDATVTANPILIHIFSAGNFGGETPSSGTYANITGMANLTGSFKMAKNILTVGALDSFGIVSPLSSKGPAYDGRIKPELSAFGQDGSSGAAALTSGAALLVQQAFRENNNGQLPDAALVKGALINSADDLDTPGPDFKTGYGSVNALNAVWTIRSQHYFSGTAIQGSVQNIDMSIPAGLRKLRITLCWTDPPALANASRALVNDLDLSLQDLSNGSSWQPWVLSSFPHQDSLLLPAKRGSDSLNNIEQITLDDPSPGNYRITVFGRQVVQGPQRWFVTYQFDTANHFSWQYPTAADPLIANEPNILRWSSTISNGATGKMEYSLDRGNSWTVIDNALPLQQEYYYWQAPGASSPIIFRMTIDGEVFVSDTTTLSRPLNLQVGFNCPDSVLLYWNKLAMAVRYDIWKLGEKYLEPFAATADTFLIFPKSGISTTHLTVSPVFPPAHAGMKTQTIDYTLQGVDCYVKNFLADLVNNNTIQLTVELGTLYHVKEIIVEKQAGVTFTQLGKKTADGGLVYSFTDAALRKGGNTYRAVIVLDDGRKIYSQLQTAYYFDNSPYLIFPNPVSRGQSLQIHTPDLQSRQLVMYNSYGQKVLQEPLLGTVNEVSLYRLPKGTYFMIILKEGVSDYSGSIIVR